MPDPQPCFAICADFGSTFTKLVLVDLAEDARNRLVATSVAPTTVDTDLMDGFAAARTGLDGIGLDGIGLGGIGAGGSGVRDVELLGCSSAGGGLRIAVLGNEALVTGEAGRRVALSSGGKVVDVIALADSADPVEVSRNRPDLVLLVGGTDGGNAEALLSGARLLAGSGLPVVVAGNVEARDRAAALLSGERVVFADNVLPRIGVLAADSARSAVREMFIEHVIGGKQLSTDPGFAAMIRGATPDLALAGAELLAEVSGLDLAVLDIGGATTDLHSVVTLDPEDASLGREVVATTPVTRTVEADLGMRWSASSTLAAAEQAGLCQVDDGLRAAASRRAADPAYLPGSGGDLDAEILLAEAAGTLAIRRHCGRSRVRMSPQGQVIERDGKNLRDIDLLVGSGGVLRHASEPHRNRILTGAIDAAGEGWQTPESPRLLVDENAVLAAVGLLAQRHRTAAESLARELLGTLA